MTRYKRNHDKQTTFTEMKKRLLEAMKDTHIFDNIPMSSLGYIAYPGYSFRSPQAAALAVSRLVRKLKDEGLISLSFRGSNGYFITQAGKAELENLNNNG